MSAAGLRSLHVVCASAPNPSHTQGRGCVVVCRVCFCQEARSKSSAFSSSSSVPTSCLSPCGRFLLRHRSAAPACVAFKVYPDGKGGRIAYVRVLSGSPAPFLSSLCSLSLLIFHSFRMSFVPLVDFHHAPGGYSCSRHMSLSACLSGCLSFFTRSCTSFNPSLVERLRTALDDLTLPGTTLHQANGLAIRKTTRLHQWLCWLYGHISCFRTRLSACVGAYVLRESLCA